VLYPRRPVVLAGVAGVVAGVALVWVTLFGLGEWYASTVHGYHTTIVLMSTWSEFLTLIGIDMIGAAVTIVGLRLAKTTAHRAAGA
jgi:hypothetical protein